MPSTWVTGDFDCCRNIGGNKSTCIHTYTRRRPNAKIKGNRKSGLRQSTRPLGYGVVPKTVLQYLPRHQSVGTSFTSHTVQVERSWPTDKKNRQTKSLPSLASSSLMLCVSGCVCALSSNATRLVGGCQAQRGLSEEGVQGHDERTAPSKPPTDRACTHRVTHEEFCIFRYTRKRLSHRHTKSQDGSFPRKSHFPPCTAFSHTGAAQHQPTRERR